MKKFLIVLTAMLIIFTVNTAQAVTFRELEKKYDAQIGVYVFDTNTRREISYHADKRFAYCSTHKVLSVAALLKLKTLDELNERKFFSEEEILSYAPITKNHVADGMTLAEICEAAVRVSDNTAANLILRELGGVENFKASLREIGDNVTEPARLEPEMNIFSPDSIDDTSTPRQLAKDLEIYLLRDLLSDDKKFLLATWMSDNAVTDELIRAGVPKDWRVLDKSGSGNYGTRNDIAVVYPPNRKPIIIAIMTRRNKPDAKFDNALIADAAKIVTARLTRKIFCQKEFGTL